MGRGEVEKSGTQGVEEGEHEDEGDARVWFLCEWERVGEWCRACTEVAERECHKMALKEKDLAMLSPCGRRRATQMGLRNGTDSGSVYGQLSACPGYCYQGGDGLGMDFMKT